MFNCLIVTKVTCWIVWLSPRLHVELFDSNQGYMLNCLLVTMVTCWIVSFQTGVEKSITVRNKCQNLNLHSSNINVLYLTEYWLQAIHRIMPLRTYDGKMHTVRLLTTFLPTSVSLSIQIPVKMLLITNNILN